MIARRGAVAKVCAGSVPVGGLELAVVDRREWQTAHGHLPGAVFVSWLAELRLGCVYMGEV